MSPTEPALLLLLAGLGGALLGAVVAWALAGRRVAGRLSAAEARAEAERERREEARGELEAAEAALTRLEREAAAGAEREAQLARGIEEHRRFVEASRAELETTFQALAATALKGSTEEFLKLADQRLGSARAQAAAELEERKKAVENLLQPVRESLHKLAERTGELEKARIAAYSRIDEQVRQLADATGRLDERTTSLATALKSSQVRGTWGEIALKNVVELAGMTEHCDFRVQETVAGEGGRQRPDMVVRMPDGKFIAVDAKAPLAAFMEAAEAPDDATRRQALTRHVRDLKNRIRELAARDYAASLEGELDLVVLFLPGDPFLGAAVSTEPRLLEDSLRQRVLIATPTTLLALLRTVAIYWQQRELARNAEKIADTARLLYDRAALFGEHLAGVGKGLETALGAYNQAVRSFERRLIPTSRKLEEMKVSEQSRRRLESPPEIEGTPRELPEPASDPVRNER